MQIPYSQRGGVPVEPMLTTQWFVDAARLAEPVIAAVEAGRVKFIPEHRYNLFMAWMREIRPWTISRQWRVWEILLWCRTERWCRSQHPSAAEEAPPAWNSSLFR